MRFGKTVIFAITILFCLLTVYMGIQEVQTEPFLSVEVSCGDHIERIVSYAHDSGHFLFLPGYANLEQMKLSYGGNGSSFLNGQPITDGMSCADLQLNQPYPWGSGIQDLGTVTIVQSSGVGTMFLDVSSGNMEYIHKKKGNEETGTLRLYSTDGQLNYEGNISAINGRGNSTWNEPKKSYSVELSSEADLLGMGAATKWILLSNANDSSNLRNQIVFDFAKAFGLPYTPDSRWVDLYLNGEYAGLYLLCERNEVHPQRVNISQNGSFLVAKDLQHRFEEYGHPYISTENDVSLRVYYSDWDYDQLQSLWQSVENAILSENGVDPVTGKPLDALIDVESWQKKHLIDEVFGNVDGGKLSQFYYLDSSNPTGKIYAGPVWDYDLTMRMQGSNQADYVEMLFVNAPGNETSLWPVALYQNSDYYNSLIQLYESQFLPLLDHFLEYEIPQYAASISGAAKMNALRWDLPNYQEKTEEIFQYMNLRKDFLNKLWLEEADYHFIIAMDAGGSLRYYAVADGEPITSLPKFESEEDGFVYRWYYADTGEVFLPENPVYADTAIFMQYEPEENTD